MAPKSIKESGRHGATKDF